MKKFFLTPKILFLSVLVLFFSCQKEITAPPIENNEVLSANEKIYLPESSTQRTHKEDKFNTFYGPQVQMGKGHVRSWVNINHGGEALAIGIEMTHGALHHLPQDPHDFDANTFILKLHQKAMELTPFKHIMINHEPQGHEPPGIYDVPHFDFHFYRTTNEERMAIPPYEVAPELFDNLPPANHLPATYFRIPGGVPQMGVHWINALAPELPPTLQPFTHTFIYGSFNGKVTFLEPMITMETLQSGNTFQVPIAQPGAFDPVNKYYPTRYSIWKNAANNRHYVSLDEMVKR